MNERKFRLIDRQIVNSNFIIKFEREWPKLQSWSKYLAKTRKSSKSKTRPGNFMSAIW